MNTEFLKEAFDLAIQDLKGKVEKTPVPGLVSKVKETANSAKPFAREVAKTGINVAIFSLFKLFEQLSNVQEKLNKDD